jgi:hypothetical protein
VVIQAKGKKLHGKSQAVAKFGKGGLYHPKIWR